MSKEAIFLPFDTETGGVHDEASLLSAHFAACDIDLNVIDELDLLIKPNDGCYNVNAEALSINKIDLITHDAQALTYSKAGGLLKSFIDKHSQHGKIKLIPVGKNIPFDVMKVNSHILGAKTWNQYVSYRMYDITTMIIMLKRQGKLDKEAPESLEGMANYIDFKFIPHTAKGDNLAGIAVVKYLEAL